MNRLLIAFAVAAAACAVSVPAVAGLADNPSFSHRLPVHVPPQARLVHVDDHGAVVVAKQGSDDPSATRVPSAGTASTGSEAEPGDDHGGADVGTTEPGDDNGGATATGHDGSVTATEPGDDNGRVTGTQSGDDRGGATATEPGGDNGRVSATEPGEETGRPTATASDDDGGGGGGHGGR